MSFSERQARLRVMELIELRAKRFRSDEDLWPLRIPREPLPLDGLIREALPEEHHQFDPLSLRTRTLLFLSWDDESAWELWLAVLPSGLKVFCDSGADESRLLATGGKHANDETERLFLRMLAESAGQAFGIEMSGGAPSRVRSSLKDRDLLTEVFLNLLEVTNAEASVREQLTGSGTRRSSDADVLGADFRHDVELWLDQALR